MYYTEGSFPCQGGNCEAFVKMSPPENLFLQLLDRLPKVRQAGHRLGWAGGAVAWDLAGNQHRLGAGLCGPGLWAAASGAADGNRPGTGRNGVPLFRLVGKYGFQSADYLLRVYIDGGGALY